MKDLFNRNKIFLVNILLVVCLKASTKAGFPNFGMKHETLRNNSPVLDVMDEIIEDHRKHFDKNDIRDFVDAYLYEIGHGAGKTEPGFSVSSVQ